jgi:dolichol-phosphate mannosyltransferase
VSPVHNELGNIPELIAEICLAVKALPPGVSCELVLVDDGSTDESWGKILEMAQRDYKRLKIRGIRLSSNFGQMAALEAGILNCSGEYVLTMDSDLQHPPSLIPLFFENRATALVVSGRLVKRQESTYKKILSTSFYKVLDLISDVHINRNVGDFRLMKTGIAKQLISKRDQGQVIRFSLSRLQLPTHFIDFEAPPRSWGKSSYNLSRMLKLAAQSVLSVTTKPLRLSFYFSTIFVLLFVLNILYTIQLSFSNESIPGWASIVGLVSAGFTGVFVCIGILSVYVGKIVESVFDLPRYLISDDTYHP